MPRQRARVDSNQPEFVAALRERGYSVCHLHQVGKGVPDLLVGIDGRNFLFELKDPDKPPSARKLTADEVSWHAEWQGQVATVTSAQEADVIIRNTHNRVDS